MSHNNTCVPGSNAEDVDPLDAEAEIGDDEATPHEVGHNIYILAYQVSHFLFHFHYTRLPPRSETHIIHYHL